MIFRVIHTFPIKKVYKEKNPMSEHRCPNGNCYTGGTMMPPAFQKYDILMYDYPFWKGVTGIGSIIGHSPSILL